MKNLEMNLVSITRPIDISLIFYMNLQKLKNCFKASLENNKINCFNIINENSMILNRNRLNVKILFIFIIHN